MKTPRPFTVVGHDKGDSGPLASTPVWIRVLFGAVPILMGVVILGAQAGVVPTDGGRFLAPPWVILSLGAGLIVFGLGLWMPAATPPRLKSAIFLCLLLLLAAVCNWTAFAPGIVYTSETTIGGWTTSAEDPIGGRIVFGAVALAVDALLAFTVIDLVRRAIRRG
jgi:hypothetical protein